MSAFDIDEPRVVELPDEDEEEEDFKECTEGPSSSSSASVNNHNNEQLPTTTTDTEDVEKEVAQVNHNDTTEAVAEGEESELVPPSPVFVHPKDIQKALAAKEAGNEYFRQKDYDNAIQCYSNAIAYCPNDDIENKEYQEQLATFYGNRAAAYFAEEEYELVIDDCSYALDHKADYVKVLLRRMQAYEKLDKLDEALADAKKIQELDPSTPKISSTV